MPGPVDDHGDDPFEGLQLDESFVAAASVREETAEERAERLERTFHEHRARAEARFAELSEARQRMRDWNLPPEPPAYATPPRRPWRRRLAVVVVISLLAVALWSSEQRGPKTSAPDAQLAQDAEASLFISGGAQPPPGVDEQPNPLGQPAALPAGNGPYAFIKTQSDGTTPVAYSPCRPIHVVLNDRTAPADGDELVQSALDRVSQATGLKFIVDGATDEVPTDERAAYEPDRYPGRWAPVLIAWSDSHQNAMLAGDVAGFGGSVGYTVAQGTVWVSGTVVLDGPDLHQITRETGNDKGARAVIEHELGHLVGLDHVNDPTELMNPTDAGGVTDFAAGDLRGLEQLGRGRCFPEV